MTEIKINTRKDLGPLHDLLLKACPPADDGSVSIPILAKDHLKMTSFGVYKWINAGRIGPEQAQRVVLASGGRVKLEEFYPFIFA